MYYITAYYIQRRMHALQGHNMCEKFERGITGIQCLINNPMYCSYEWILFMVYADKIFHFQCVHALLSSINSYNLSAIPYRFCIFCIFSIWTKLFFIFRSIWSDQLLSAIASICRSDMRFDNCAIISLSGINWSMAVRRYSMQIRWISRSDFMVNNGVYIYVDFSWSLSSCTKTVTLWNGSNKNPVSFVIFFILFFFVLNKWISNVFFFNNSVVDSIAHSISNIFFLFVI